MARLFLFVLLLALPGNALYARDSDMPRSILAIVESLGQEVPVGGEFSCPSIPGNPTLYTVEDEGEIVQIGARVLSSDVRDTVDSLACDCIERVWLELKLRGNTDEMRHLLNLKKISMTVNGHQLGSIHFDSLDKAESIIRNACSLDYSVKNGTIILSFKETDGDCFRITLPTDRSVLSPMDKNEQEHYLVGKLIKTREDFHPKHLSIPASVIEEKGYYVSSHQCYMIDSVNNKIYYKKHNNEFAVVFNDSEPMTSLKNVAMGAVPCERFKDLNIDITFKTYDPVSEKCIIPLFNFLGFMEKQGMDFYCADFFKNGESRILLVFCQPVHHYVNMLTIIVPPGFSVSSPGVLSAELDAYIPQNNIKSLFNNHN